MKSADRLLQTLRIRKAVAYLPRRGRILDIGCGDGALFRHLGDRFTEGIGIDPDLQVPVDRETYRLIKGWFPKDIPTNEGFDAITMLATLEHIPTETQVEMAQQCAQMLNPGGRLIITVPSKRVDTILSMLKRVRIIEGMSLEQHYGFDPRMTPARFSTDGMSLIKTERFELGLNHLFVFEKNTSSDVR